MDKSEELLVIPTRSTQDIQECFNNPAHILRRRGETIGSRPWNRAMQNPVRDLSSSTGVNHHDDVTVIKMGTVSCGAPRSPARPRPALALECWWRRVVKPSTGLFKGLTYLLTSSILIKLPGKMRFARSVWPDYQCTITYFKMIAC